jgi:carbamoyl-phosphate synthase small subunit
MIRQLEHKKPAVLLLSDGTRWDGYLAGAEGTVMGEICFNTGMTGYQEIFTDPSYTGQVVIMTNPHIGNYGVTPDEAESQQLRISGLICKSFSRDFSRTQAEQSLQDYFKSQNIPAIEGIDTRELVRHIRDKGVMNCIISSEILDSDMLKQRLSACPDMNGLELSSVVSATEPFEWGQANASYRVAAYDFGIKYNILRNLADRDCFIKVFPAKTPASELIAWNPDGFFLSNGPGDPAAMPYAVENVKLLLEQNRPIFGICLGHQILAQTQGVSTYKMFNGHRGINHPVKNLLTGRSEITSQNHGFAVIREEVEKHSGLEITHVHLNDHTVAGIRLKHKPAFSVQYHPEAGPGPHDSRYLFDEFVALMKAHRQ